MPCSNPASCHSDARRRFWPPSFSIKPVAAAAPDSTASSRLQPCSRKRKLPRSTSLTSPPSRLTASNWPFLRPRHHRRQLPEADLSPRPAPPHGIPTGFCHSAQGCEERATLGCPAKYAATLNELHRITAPGISNGGDATLSGLRSIGTYYPG